MKTKRWTTSLLFRTVSVLTLPFILFILGVALRPCVERWQAAILPAP